MALSVLELRPTDWEDYVDVLVDGAPLAERLMAADRAIDKKAYVYKDTGLGWGDVDATWITVFDREMAVSGVRPGLLFTCSGCNVVGCGDTDATVTTTPTTISLSDFSRPKRPLPTVAPVTFDREQFLAEVERLNRWHAATWPDEERRKAERRALRLKLSSPT